MQILKPAKPTKYPILEKHLEAHFAKECKRLKILSLKLSVRYSTGWPDRLVASRRGLSLAELKTPTGVLSPKQKFVFAALKLFSIQVAVLRTKIEITEYLEGRV